MKLRLPVCPSVRLSCCFLLPKMSGFLYRNTQGSPTLTLLNAHGVLDVINMLNVLNYQNLLYVLNVYNMPVDALLVVQQLLIFTFQTGPIMAYLSAIILNKQISM